MFAGISERPSRKAQLRNYPKNLIGAVLRTTQSWTAYLPIS